MSAHGTELRVFATEEGLPNGAEDRFQSTPGDMLGMQRVGHRQELVRHYRAFSMVAFVAMAIPFWQLTIFQITPGLLNGGMPVLMYSNIWSFIGFGPIIFSMAEMASMAPVAGAQYHWVSEFAPENYQRILSYITGWTSTLAWQAGNAGSLLLIGTLIQTVIQLNNPRYASLSWHGTLLAIAVVVISCATNVFAAKRLPYWQNTAFMIGFFVYFAFIVPIWVAGPRASASQVWTQFKVLEGAWPNLTLAIFIGQQPAIIGQVGVDTAAHMSEDVRDASLTVPRVMVSVYALNLLMNMLTTATLCYHMPDPAVALDDSSAYPAIWVLRQVMSVTWLTVFLVAITLLLIVGATSSLAAVSRNLFAFARDGGLPLSDCTAKVDERRCVPANAYLLTAFTSTVMCCIYIGNAVAFYAISSLCAVALLQCYCLSVGCILWRRIYHPQTLPHARFSLGRYGVLLNTLAVAFGVWCLFWCFWPTTYPITAGAFNWSGPIFVAVLLLATIYYVSGGRSRYQSPVTRIEGRKDY